MNARVLPKFTKTDGLTEDDVLMAVLDAGAEEVLDEGDVFTVVSAPTDCPKSAKALDEAELDYNNATPYSALPCR